MYSIEDREITDEVSQNFIDSSYDTNTNRAFPDARDGLKPGQRACLWEMYKKGYTSDKPHVKSAKISGAVCSDIWPHGTTAIYDTFVRMSQPFINNVPEVDFHGSNGNQILGADPAADRYTEARLSQAAEYGLFQGIEKDSVDMMLNFSEDQWWPTILPAVLPRLLVNGCMGIGVSISNTHLPFNLCETTELIIDYMNTGNIKYPHIPDFPSGGVLVDVSEAEQINRTGKGRVVLEARSSIKGREIQFTELCYQTYIEPIIEQIKAKVDSGAVKGVASVDNKSDKRHLCLSVEVSRTADPQEVLEQLYQCTDLRQTYTANQIAIVGKTPKLLNLKEMVDIYIAHNVECIRREFEFDYQKASNRMEIVDGLLICVKNIDKVVAVVRSSKGVPESSVRLQSEFGLTEAQAKAVLDMRLAKLSSLEVGALEKERVQLEKQVSKCDKVRASEREQKKVLVKRLSDLALKFGTPRRTKVAQKRRKQKEQKMATVRINDSGYIKKNSENDTKGSLCREVADEAMLYLFSNKGKMYRICAQDVPENDRGIALGAMVEMDNDEHVVFICIDSCEEIAVMTSDRKAKRVAFSELAGKTRNLKGMPYIKLNENETVVFVNETKYAKDILKSAELMSRTSKGKSV